MGRIPDHVVEDVRQRADIVDVVGRCVTLRRSGSRHWGLCPFHSEKTPSFQVHSEKQSFHCFGCGVGGDVFAFRMQHDALEFPDAVRSLARECGVVIPETDGTDRGKVAPLYEMNERALEFFRHTLRSPEGAPARRYLEGRGLPSDLVDLFQLGFAPARWDGFLTHLAQDPGPVSVAERAGLVASRQTGDGFYDRFRGRVTFPLHETDGRVVGFGARALGDDTPKYLNTPETPIYRKGRVFFGLSLAIDAIRARGRAVVVEGYFDVLALVRAGIAETVAPCGTAVTSQQARRLRRYTREVILLFDGDEAGQRAAERALPVLCTEGLRVRAAFLPPGEDPDTLIARRGADAVRECVAAAVPLIGHLIEKRLTIPDAGAWQAADAAREIAPILAAVPDPIERASYLREVAGRLELPLDAIEAAVRGASTRAAWEAEQSHPAPPAVEIDTLSRSLLGAVLARPHLIEWVVGFPPEAWPSGPSGKLLTATFAALQEHGPGAVAHLLSPVAGELPDELKTALAAIVARDEAATGEEAERAVRDCVAQLRLRALDRESRDLTLRLKSCTNSAELDMLLERKQQILQERMETGSQVHQV